MRLCDVSQHNRVAFTRGDERGDELIDKLIDKLIDSLFFSTTIAKNHLTNLTGATECSTVFLHDESFCHYPRSLDTRRKKEREVLEHKHQTHKNHTGTTTI